MAPKFSGGIRQRLGLAKKASVPRLKEDPLSAELVNLYSHGSLSAGQVGNLAAAGSSSSSSQAPQATFEPETRPRQPLKRLSRAKATPKAKTTGKLVKTKSKESHNSSRSLHRTFGHESPHAPSVQGLHTSLGQKGQLQDNHHHGFSSNTRGPGGLPVLWLAPPPSYHSDLPNSSACPS